VGAETIVLEDADRELLRRIGRESAARRRVVAGNCMICGAEIRGLATRRYCSAACRVKAHRERQEHLVKTEAAKQSGQSQQAPERESAPPPRDRRVTRAAVAAFLERRDAIIGNRVFADSTEVLRANRNEHHESA